VEAAAVLWTPRATGSPSSGAASYCGSSRPIAPGDEPGCGRRGSRTPRAPPLGPSSPGVDGDGYARWSTRRRGRRLVGFRTTSQHTPGSAASFAPFARSSAINIASSKVSKPAMTSPAGLHTKNPCGGFASAMCRMVTGPSWPKGPDRTTWWRSGRRRVRRHSARPGMGRSGYAAGGAVTTNAPLVCERHRLALRAGLYVRVLSE
jgi:hypothetical protein